MRRPLTIALATLAVLATPALAASDGTYKGIVAKDKSLKVTLKVKGNKVTKFVATVYGSCGLSNLLLTVAYPPDGSTKGAKIKGNKFKATFSGNPDVEDDKRVVKGTFSGAKVTGTIHIEGPCSFDGKYSAKR